MKLYSSKSDIWYYLVVYMEIMAVCLFGDILPSDSQAMIWCRSIFDQVHNSPSFYAFNFILLLTGAVYMLNKQMHRKVFRISKCVSYVTSILLVVVCSSKHPMAIEYLALAFSFLTCLLIFELNKLFVGAKESDIPNAGVEGFVADCSKQEDLQNVGWDKYAESLLTRLEGTNAVDGAFTVSLTGSWGTGKTTFLSYLKDHMHKNGLVYMDFNPWLSNSTETIIQDFFQALNSKLCEQGIELEDEIDEYVKLLFKWGNESLADKVSEVFPFGDGKDLSVLREELSSGLNLLDGKLYILIDDIDRLQGKEIFEVLKLIRNTADFNHIVYIVTCDKEYVLQSLQDQIKKPDEYLKKIFQLELKFPQYERYLLTHLFKTELLAHTHYDAGLQNQLNNLEMELGRDNIYLRDYLSNFRDAKRLVNIFMLNLDYIAKQGVVADFNIKELFLILLFEYTDEVGFNKFRVKGTERSVYKALCLNIG
ncbi:KAP family P-loop NTPase fold protein [Segatella copri]|uniref:KAP family P-loop NTPase fold protein n=1 Tax=Segatella copri TaxID=165179 RepID=UPI002FEEB713